jgi:hypothetical protein
MRGKEGLSLQEGAPVPVLMATSRVDGENLLAVDQVELSQGVFL